MDQQVKSSKKMMVLGVGIFWFHSLLETRNLQSHGLGFGLITFDYIYFRILNHLFYDRKPKNRSLLP
jgi:hypothetical protein